MFREGHVYRLMTPAQWQVAVASSFLPYNEDDERDGFLHLSAPHQVLETAARHYTAHDQLLAAGVEESAIARDLKWEVSRGGDRFPHFFGFLPTGAVSHLIRVVRQADGTYQAMGEEAV